MNNEALQQIEQLIEYNFKNRNLLAGALTHASAVDNRLLSNERLEFLGDAVLGAVICLTLYERFPNYLEGDLTKIKSRLVSRRTCATVARGLGLHKHLNIGKGMTGSRALSGSLAAGLFEAIVAALYVDGGIEAAKKFILKTFAPLIEQADSEHSQDNFKSVLQQYSQQHLGVTPMYVLLDEKGPDHDKCFESQVRISQRCFPSAWGPNKKHAEQKAAFNALLELGLIEGQYPHQD